MLCEFVRCGVGRASRLEREEGLDRELDRGGWESAIVDATRGDLTEEIPALCSARGGE